MAGDRGIPETEVRWLTGHIGASFADRSAFEGRAMAFLAEGARRRQKLLYVADDPKLAQWPEHLLSDGALVVASTRDLYGDDLRVDGSRQRSVLDGIVEGAISEGYAGIRAAVDSTSLVLGPDRLRAWLEWEEQADDLMEADAATWLCAFDRSRLVGDVLDQLMRCHDRTPGGPSGWSRV